MARPDASRTASALVDLVADPGSFEEWDAAPASQRPPSFADTAAYRERLADAAARVGRAEAVLTGLTRVDGRPLAVVASEVGFLGGSIGVTAGEGIRRAVDRATDLALPLLAITASGGIRIQEGAPALLQMVKIADAVRRHRSAGLAYVVYLTDPTTGGVLASWASLGTITLVEPEALIGVVGPRAREALGGAPTPGRTRVAERLLERGRLDALVPPAELRDVIDRVLAHVSSEVGPAPVAGGVGDAAPRPDGRPVEDAWDSVLRSRDPGRPGALDLLRRFAEDLVVIGGARPSPDARLVAGLARIVGTPAVVVAHNRSAPGGARLGPHDLRVAKRAIRVAGELGLPLLTIVDTPGADLGTESEEDGLAIEIAECIDAMLGCPAPTLAVLLGEGGGGPALPFLATDRVMAARHGWLAPIAPEAASAILYRDVGHAAAIANEQWIDSVRLHAMGIVDVVVPEPDGDGPEGAGLLTALGDVMARELRVLRSAAGPSRLEARRRRFLGIGSVGEAAS